MQSPNKAGRPRGIVDRRMRLNKALMDDASALLEVTKAKAMEGDMSAMSLLLARAVPTLKAEGERVEFQFDAKASQVEQVESVLQAIAGGLVPVDTGKQIIDAISQLSGVRQVAELETRIRALEEHRR